MKIEIRADNSVHIEGYVNAVERDSNIINVPSVGRCVEQIRAGVFDKALSSGADVSILENHDNSRRLGSISEGNLKLYEDNIGLRASADITDIEIVGKARRGELKGWSFGFICTDSEIEQRSGNVPRRIVKGLDLSEVSLIDGSMKPCYSGTSVEVRADGFIREFRAAADDNIEYSILDSADTSTDAENAPVDSTADGEDVETRSDEPDYSYYDAMLRYLELRYNPYHDPGNGRFCSGGGGGGGGVLVVPKGQKGKGYYGAIDTEQGEDALANEFDKWQKNKQKPKRKTKAELQREEYANARQSLNDWNGNEGVSNRIDRIANYGEASRNFQKYQEKVKKYGFDDEKDVADYLTSAAKVYTAKNDEHSTSMKLSSNDLNITRHENTFEEYNLLSGQYTKSSNPTLEIEISGDLSQKMGVKTLESVFTEVDAKVTPHYGHKGRGSSVTVNVSDLKAKTNGRKKAEMRAEEDTDPEPV